LAALSRAKLKRPEDTILATPKRAVKGNILNASDIAEECEPMNSNQLGQKEKEIMDFHQHIFDSILQSPTASEKLKQGVRYTIMRMEQRDAAGMVQYYWSAIIGTERSIGFASLMRKEGFDRSEEELEEFRVRFDDQFLRRLRT
jgi:hypothetical protein